MKWISKNLAAVIGALVLIGGGIVGSNPVLLTTGVTQLAAMVQSDG